MGEILYCHHSLDVCVGDKGQILSGVCGGHVLLVTPGPIF